MKRYLWPVLFIVLLVSAFFAGVYYARLETIPLEEITESTWPQNATDYINIATKDRSLLSSKQQELGKIFALHQFFLPWSSYSPDKLQFVLAKEKSYVDKIQNRIEYGINFHPYAKKFIQSIIANMDLATYPNYNRFAIIVHNVSTREIPTSLPAFDNPRYNIGYPFDNFGYMALWVGQPVHVLQRSKDGAWYLISYNELESWVKKVDISFVDQKFIGQYRQNKFAALTKDNVPVKDDKSNFIFYSRVGTLLPFIDGHVYSPFPDAMHDHTTLIKTDLSDKSYSIFPMSPTPYHLAIVMNGMLGDPYTWNAVDYRECSLTLKNLFMTFGIWLPKNSQHQLTAFPFVNLQNLNDQDKLDVIKKRGKPFLTLLGTPCHVTLYLGLYHNHAMVFEDRWGFHTKDIFGDKGRLVIGKTIINSLEPDKRSPLVSSYLITDLNKMTFMSDYPFNYKTLSN